MNAAATPAAAPNTQAPPATQADGFAVRSEVLRLSAQPGGPMLLVQLLLDCGVAGLFAWQYSPLLAGLWLALVALSTAYRGFLPQRLPVPLTPENLPGALREHRLRIGLHEGVHGLAGLLLFHPAEPVAQLLLAVVMMGMTLSSAFSVSYVARTMQLGIGLLMGPIILMAMLVGSPLMRGVAALGLGLMILVLRLVAERSRKLEESIGQRHQESVAHAQAVASLRAAQHVQAERLRFFSAANHDLRQPVMAIGLQTEVLRQQLHSGAPAAALEQTVAALARAQEALERLINQLLELGRIEAAADALALQPIALAPLLAEFANQVSEADGARLRVHCAADALAWSDPLALRRMIANLVDNALKFTPRGRVLLACRRAADGWRIEVRDNGIGIPAEAQERVFGDFEQVGNVERNLRRGHGLGLSIVRRLAQRLSTQVTLRSAPGRGSVFAFVLPRAPAGTPLPDAPALVSTPALRPGLVVLVVEDNGVVADSLVALLRQWQARPRVCASADEALAQTDLAQVDVALCDIRLPGALNGVTLATRLQQLHPAMTMALVSADIDAPTQHLARERGWYALRKPVQPEQLRAVLRAATHAPSAAPTSAPQIAQ